VTRGKKPVVGVIGSLHLMEGKFPAQRVGDRMLCAIAEAVCPTSGS
jgi:hypothetical protein